MDPRPARDDAETGEPTTKPKAASRRVTSRREATRRDVLRLGAGAAAAATAMPALTGGAAAHFPDELAIDVRPWSDANVIVTKWRGIAAVAILGTEGFDPTSEPVRYRFGASDVVSDGGGTRPLHDGYVVDVDDDGRDDLLLLFPTDEAGFDGDESTARVEWERTESGEHGLSGTDSVTVVDGSRSRWSKRRNRSRRGNGEKYGKRGEGGQEWGGGER